MRSRTNLQSMARQRGYKILIFIKQQQGVSVPYKLIAKRILEDEARKFAITYKQAKLDEIKSGLTERQAIFNRNEELTK